MLNVDLSARDALNPDDAGRATSVAVRVYLLKDHKLFDGASYDDLLKNARTRQMKKSLKELLLELNALESRIDLASIGKHEATGGAARSRCSQHLTGQKEEY